MKCSVGKKVGTQRRLQLYILHETLKEVNTQKIHDSVVPYTVTTRRMPAKFNVTAREERKANSKLHLLNEQNLHDVGSVSEASPRHSLQVFALRGRIGRLRKPNIRHRSTKYHPAVHKSAYTRFEIGSTGGN
jgi:hypothetical protein